MLFHSTPFLLLLISVTGVYYFLPRRPQNILLLAASYLFFGWWNWRFCGLLLFSTLLNYFCAQSIHTSNSAKAKRQWLLVGLTGNLTVLGLFKYFDFFTHSAVKFLSLFAIHADWPTLHLVLPIGISFFTFQGIAYLMDVYRGEKPTNQLLDFGLFISFFPQLVAGPIERAHRLLPQFSTQRKATYENISSGLLLILIGYVKKIAIADFLAPHVNAAFTHPGSLGGGELLAGLLMFSLQIYGDFAGYSDIARGAARLLGIHLMVNFNQPYFATSITEFWQRWHISLSTWLRDYLYIPLGGNRKGPRRTYLNLLMTMLLGGLWHGAAWTFVIWGGLHGILLGLERRFVSFTKEPAKNITRFLRMGLTFLLVTFVWTFFRATSFENATLYLQSLMTSGNWDFYAFLIPAVAGLFILLLDIPVYRSKNHDAFWHWHWLPRGFFIAFCFLILTLTYRGEELTPFIYFQF